MNNQFAENIYFIFKRNEDVDRISHLIKANAKIEFAKTNHWIKLGNETFNGFTKEDYYKMKGEINA